MIVKRFSWRCNTCNSYFKTWEHEPAVCPKCGGGSAPQAAHTAERSSLPAPGIMSDRTKLTTEVAEGAMRDMGLTNMRDNQREGDISAPPLTHDQIRLRDAAGGFWRGVGGLGGMIPDGHAGVDKAAGMRAVQNLAKRLEGRA